MMSSIMELIRLKLCESYRRRCDVVLVEASRYEHSGCSQLCVCHRHMQTYDHNYRLTLNPYRGIFWFCD
jgi:hypothetical protein